MITFEKYDKENDKKQIPASILYYIKAFFAGKAGKYGTKTRYENCKWYYGDVFVAEYKNTELFILVDYDKCNGSLLKMVSYIIEFYTITSDNKNVSFLADSKPKFDAMMQSLYS